METTVEAEWAFKQKNVSRDLALAAFSRFKPRQNDGLKAFRGEMRALNRGFKPQNRSIWKREAWAEAVDNDGATG